MTGRSFPVTGTRSIRAFHVGAGFNIPQMSEELSNYTDVLLGRDEPPIDAGIMTLAEVANAYYARAREMEMEILDGERVGAILKNSGAYKFRTGKLRSFIEMSRNCYELGSRRVSAAQLEHDEMEGR